MEYGSYDIQRFPSGTQWLQLSAPHSTQTRTNSKNFKQTLYDSEKCNGFICRVLNGLGKYKICILLLHNTLVCVRERLCYISNPDWVVFNRTPNSMQMRGSWWETTQKQAKIGLKQAQTSKSFSK